MICTWLLTQLSEDKDEILQKWAMFLRPYDLIVEMRLPQVMLQLIWEIAELFTRKYVFVKIPIHKRNSNLIIIHFGILNRL